MLQLQKLLELLTAGDLQRCGCAEVDLQKFFTDPYALRCVKATPGRYLSTHNLRNTPQEIQPQATQKSGGNTYEARHDDTVAAGQEQSSAKTANKVVQASTPGCNQKAKRAETTSWELPPLAMLAPISAEMGTSLWCVSSLGKSIAAPTGASSLPFSAVLRQVLDDVAREKHSECGLEESEYLPALGSVPTCLWSCEGKKSRKLSAAELWLGADPGSA